MQGLLHSDHDVQEDQPPLTMASTRKLMMKPDTTQIEISEQLFLPMQSCMLQVCSSVADPGQYSPPKAGDGLSQSLDLIWTPSPQEAEQLAHCSQLDQKPGTVIKGKKK